MTLSYSYAGARHTFSTVAGLRDALLGSYPAWQYVGAPVALINRDDPAPAWGWLPDLLRDRPGWWSATGIALQHAARDGGDNARIALADFLDSYWESVVLLDWTAPIAARWPDVRAGLSGAAFGRPDHGLASIVAGQREYLRVAGSADPLQALLAQREAADAGPPLDLQPIM